MYVMSSYPDFRFTFASYVVQETVLFERLFWQSECVLTVPTYCMLAQCRTIYAKSLWLQL